MARSIIDGSNYCYICSRYKMRYVLASDTHHIFGAANRNKSDEDGLTVRLCRRCHSQVHDTSNIFYHELHRIGEQAWLDHYHKTIQDFILRYGKNYIYDL